MLNSVREDEPKKANVQHLPTDHLPTQVGPYNNHMKTINKI